MTEPEADLVPAPPPPDEPQRYPFWGYYDLALFIGLSLPCLLAGAGVVRIVFWVFGMDPERRAVVLLPAQFLGYGFLFFALYLVLKLRYQRPFWTGLEWVRPNLPAVAFLSFGLVLAISIGLFGALIKTPDIPLPMKELLRDRSSIALLVLFATTLGPVFEELAFRGFVQPLLVRSFGVAGGILLAALPFGLLHLEQYGRSWRHVLLITIAGCAFGAVRHRWGTLAATWMHATYNATFFVGFLTQTKELPKAW